MINEMISPVDNAWRTRTRDVDRPYYRPPWWWNASTNFSAFHRKEERKQRERCISDSDVVLLFIFMPLSS